MIKTTNIILDSFLISSEIELTDAFIKGAERVFRDSFEYKKLLAYYRNDEDQNTCLFIKDIDFSSKGLTLEFHHIIRLYDLALIVIISLVTKVDVCRVPHLARQFYEAGIVRSSRDSLLAFGANLPSLRDYLSA